MTEFIATEFGGHNVFNEVETKARISFTLLSMAYKEDSQSMNFGIVDDGVCKRPVVTISYLPCFIDLLTGRLVDAKDATIYDFDVDVTYYNGTFTFKTSDGLHTAFIDKEVLIRNYGFSIID
ncbi:MAG: hypothetical protein E7005_00710 [Alphaproteobacteria bacterium]|nr:hypothetical protein [Alphaproteobacteria bacterium]